MPATVDQCRALLALRGLGASTSTQQQSTQVSVPVTVYATGGSISDSANVGSQFGKVIESARTNAQPIVLGGLAALAAWALWKAVSR